MSVRKITEAERLALRRKSAYQMPDNPTQRGVKPDEVKKFLAGSVVDERDSVVYYLNRMADDVNEDGEAAAAVAQGIRDDLTLAEGRVEELEGAQEQLRQDFDNLELDDNRPVKTEAAGLSVTVSGEVVGAVRALLRYQARKALFRTQAEAAEFAQLWQAAEAALNGGWLTVTASVSGSMTGYHIDPGKVWVRWYWPEGTMLQERKIDEGGVLPSPPEDPTRDGYAFVAWVANPALVDGKVMADTDVTPSWQALPVGLYAPLGSITVAVTGQEISNLLTIASVIASRLTAVLADGSHDTVTVFGTDLSEPSLLTKVGLLDSNGSQTTVKVVSVNETVLDEYVEVTIKRVDIVIDDNGDWIEYIGLTSDSVEDDSGDWIILNIGGGAR